MSTSTSHRDTQESHHPDEVDIVVVGAGFGGLYMVYRGRQMGLSVRAFEAAEDVGGTWYWNSYPGSRCDTESVDYSYSFDADLQQEWEWTERFASQPEILAYLKHVADRFDLRKDITFSTRVTSAVFDEAAGRWMIGTDRGDHISAQFCVMATGCLSTAQIPAIPGLDEFDGSIYHTGRWPKRDIDFRGQRVAVIGTGSSGIQCIPVIARQAERLHVLQRTANFSIPSRNAALDPEYVRQIKADYPGYRRKLMATPKGYLVNPNPQRALDATPRERDAEFQRRWEIGGLGFTAAFSDIMTDLDANALAAEFVRRKIRETVRDATTAASLLPRDHPIASKRLCVDTGYFETYNASHVSLVDLRDDPIQRLTSRGIQTQRQVIEVDSIVFATGFDAMTGTLFAMDIRGREGHELKRKWSEGPRSYLGLVSSGFPNMFTITGPGSPSVLTNMVMSIEQHVDWIADCIAHMRTHGLDVIDATPDAEGEWVDHVEDIARRALYYHAKSWWGGANIEGKPQVFMAYAGGLRPYRELCDQVAIDGYRGFELSSAPRSKVASGLATDSRSS
jgi:cyclohexanone monooxygenase